MIVIRVLNEAGVFAEDKDIAAHLRERELKPALDRGENVRIDFTGVDGATQSFIHAMISELIRRMGPGVLSRIEFRKCNPTVRSVVEIVAEYSQLGDDNEVPANAAQPDGASDDSAKRNDRRG